MTEDALVAALRSRDPGAPAAMYDAHADDLYAYCWFLLRGRDAARTALCDAFVAAEAHVHRLRDPARLRPWLYALARLECARHEPAGRPDVALAEPDRDDTDRRLMAWHAVTGLPGPSREILELRLRHGLSEPELGPVLGHPAKNVRGLLDTARAELTAALTAELFARKGPSGCAGRVEAVGSEQRGPLTAEARHRLLRHAAECAVCGALRPQTVSAAKVYGLLPRPRPDEAVRRAVLACFLDPDRTAHRLRVATRPRDFAADGFPRQRPVPATRPGPARTAAVVAARRPGPTRTAVAAAAAVMVLGAAVAGVVRWGGSDGRTAAPIAAGASPHRPGVPPPGGSQALRGLGFVEGSPVSATFPLGARASAAPPTALPDSASPGGEHLPVPGGPGTVGNPGGRLSVSPLFLDLGTGSTGSVRLAAQDGPVTWHGRVTGPLALGRSSGRLDAGESVTLTVRVDRTARSKGEGTISFRPGGETVTVTWRVAEDHGGGSPHHSPPPGSPRPSGGGTPPRDTSPPAGTRSDPPSDTPAPAPEPRPEPERTPSPSESPAD